MANLPLTIDIELNDLVTLLGYYWSVVNSHVGDLGSSNYDETVAVIGSRSKCRVTPEELESLIYHMKQAIFEKIKPVNLDLRHKSYYKIMKKLNDDIPQLFKTLPSGEITFINFEDRKNERS